MDISFEGIGQVNATFKVEEGVKDGMAVVMTGDGTVGLGQAGGTICGVVIHTKGGMAAVQVTGMVEVAYSGTAPTVGYDVLSVDGAGNIAADLTSGISYMVVAVNTAEKTAVIKL